MCSLEDGYAPGQAEAAKKEMKQVIPLVAMPKLFK